MWGRVAAVASSVDDERWWYVASGPATIALLRVLTIATGCYLLLVGVISALTAIAPGDSPTARVLSGVTAALLIAAAVLALTRERPRPWAVIVLGLAATATGLFAGDITNPRVPGPATYALASTAMFACARLRPPAAAAVTAVGILGYVAVGLPSLDDVLYRADMQVITIGIVAAEIGFVGQLVRSACRADEVADRRRAELIEQEAALEETRVMAEVRRVLHDDVVGTLALLARSGLSSEEAQDQARAAAESLSRLGGER